MIPEIIIILLLVGILVLLLRHWPETEGVVRQQLNVRKPLEEHEKIHQRVQPPWWQQAGTKAASLWEVAKAKFARDPELTHEAPEAVLAPADVPLAEEKPVSVDALLRQAETAQRSGNYQEAEQSLVQAAAVDPKNPKIYSRLGIVYLEQGENWNEAEEAFSQALKYDARNGYVHNNLGLVLYNQDKYAAAAREFEAAIVADDKVASRQVNLGLAYMSLRQFTKAESAFKRAMKLDPTNQEYVDLLQEAGERRKRHRAAA